MYTIYDYLKYYKDYSLEDLKWNQIDNLFLACLVYMPLKSFKNQSYSVIVKKILNCDISDVKDTMVPKVLELLNIAKDSKRYENMKLLDFTSILDNNTQFGALTIKIGNIKVISFRGSDRSVIGWLENFRVAYSYPTYTQTLGINYLNNNLSLFDKNVYVVGHSKGGNLAMVSSMELNNLKFNKIKGIYNFDGPGLKLKEFNSLKYQKIKNKLFNIVPTSSYIGTLLYNENYQAVTTNAHAINIHYPTSWNIFGTQFVKGELQKRSLNLNKRTTINLEKIDEEKMQKIFEESFKIFKARETKNIKISLNDIRKIIKNISKMDPELSKYTSVILTSIIELKEKKHK